MTTEKTLPTKETIAAADRYAETLRNWDKVHVAFLNNEASRDEDIAAWDERKQAFEELKQLEADLSQAQSE